jgi:cobalt-zinc-cadmium efflux system outer membrane protein
MRVRKSSRSTRVVRVAAVAGLVSCGLVGCQSYERSALDLGAHRLVVDARLDQMESIRAFAARLDTPAADAKRFAIDDGLSVGEGEVLALFYNRDLHRARLQAGVALAQREHAGRWADPVLGFDGTDVLSAADPFDFGVTLNLTIPISGRLGVERDRADVAYALELQRLLDMEWDVRARVRKQWASWSATRERLALFDEQIAQIEHVSMISDRLEEAGELARAEARLLRIEFAQQRSARAQAMLEERSMRSELHALMGLAPDARVKLIASMAIHEPMEHADPIERLIASNTQLGVQRARYRVSEETLHLEVRKQYPDLTIGTGYGREEDEDQLLLGFSLPIPVLNANRGGIAKARAEREVARADAESAFEQIAYAYRQSADQLESLRAQRDVYAREIIPMLDEQASELERLINLGDVNTLLLLETITRGYNAKSHLLDLQVGLQHASIEIQRLLGPDELDARTTTNAPDDDRLLEETGVQP